MIANPGEAAANARNAFKNDENVTVVEIPINDGWTRDWGPSVSFLSLARWNLNTPFMQAEAVSAAVGPPCFNVKARQ